MTNEYHTPVLVEKVVEYLITTPDGVYVDATIGGGGHAESILQHLSAHATLVGFDADNEAMEYASRRLKPWAPQVVLIHENFVRMREMLHERRIKTVSGILLDLGISSFQIDEERRGFSFQSDQLLDMRMDRRQQVSASMIVNTADEQELARIFREYGEERFARRIARRIVRERSKHPVETTEALAAIVRRVTGGRFVKKSLARVFQALRIAVNNELHNLRVVMSDIVELLEVGGRAVVISYHSLEDRIVKEFFKTETAEMVVGPAMVSGIQKVPRLRTLTKKPIVPTENEIASNSRARSAKLRAAERR